MFKKLKDKIAEEVKSSPSRIQQLAQVAQAAVSSASSTTSESVPSNDNFFSITEEDTPQNSPHHLNKSSNSISNFQNASSLTPNNGSITSVRTRRLSNSSMASDVSFRLPTFDSSAAVYNFQSDLDASASEFEDSASTVGYEAQLDVISKEKLYDAYKKSLERYQKYRSRYSELVRRYRDLERDNNKARSVLVETQDKALRRISELREQCNLEQQAKAHLESALRMEMDEQQCFIKALKTKLSLLGENPEEITKNGNENLISLTDVNGLSPTIDSDNLININDGGDNDLNDSTDRENLIVAGASIMINDSNEKIKNLEAQLISFKHQITDEKKKSNELSRLLEASQKQVKELISREEENTILIAQNKLAIHSELENREKEMKSLKIDAKQSASEKECLNEIVTELRQLNSKANASVKELSDAKRALEEKVDELKKNAITAEHDNKELRAKVIVLESEKQSTATKNSLELEKFKARYDSIQRKNEQLEEITRTRVIESHEKLETELKHLKMAHADISKQLMDEQSRNNEIDRKYQELLTEHQETINRMTIEFDSAKADKIKLESRFKQLFEEKGNLSIELENLKTNLNDANARADRLEMQMVQLTQDNETANETINQLNDKLQTKETETVKESTNIDVTNLKEKIDSLKNDKRDLEKTLEKEIRDKSELQTQVTNILQEIGRLEEQLKEVKQSYSQLETEKLMLEEKSASLADGASNELVHVQELTVKIKEFESKLKQIECENSQLAEKNCLLEENNNRLLAAQREFENNLKKESASKTEANDRITALITEIDSLKELNDNIQDKLKKSLADYAELFNTKEQMDQEHRSMLDRINEMEKKHSILIEQQTNLSAEKDNKERELQEMLTELRNNDKDNQTLHKQYEDLTERNNQVMIEFNSINSALNDAKSEVDALNIKLNEQNSINLDLEAKLQQLTNENDEMQKAQQKFNELEMNLDGFDQIKIENEYLTKSIKQLEEDIKVRNDENLSLNQTLNELREKAKSQQCELYVLLEEKNERSTVFDEKDKEIEQLKSICQRSQEFSQELQNEVKQLKEQVGSLKLLNDEIQDANDSLETKHNKFINDFESLQQSNNQLNDELKSKLNEFTHLQNEYSATKSAFDAKSIEITETEQRLANTEKELNSCRAIINDLNTDLNNQSSKVENDEQEINELRIKINELESKLASVTSIDESDALKRMNETLRYDLAELKGNNQREINELNHEIDELRENARAYREKQLETDQLNATNAILSQQLIQLKEQIAHHQASEVKEIIKLSENHMVNASPNDNVDELKKEKEELEQKIGKILNEVQDVSNRNLFLEQQCENYLILEQQNERLKLQNSKLSRQLDETLVSMHHSDDISANTEFEYLKNIMFQYLTNNVNSNGATLIKVIAAVLKFTPQQTQVVLEKEAHRKTLVGQINNLL